MAVVEDLSEDEAYLYTLLMTDYSGIDQAEFLWHDPDSDGGVWRAWFYQWKWFHNIEPLQIDQCARSVGKSLSIKLRGFVFPLLWPGQEMVITAPELVHLEPITRLIENQIYDCRLSREMLPRSRSAITHRPFQIDFTNGSHIIGRIPQRDGKGVKGCSVEGTPILTKSGMKLVEDLNVGDEVLTHLNRWRPVIQIQEDVNDCYEVTGQGSLPLTVSCDHRFYGAENLATSKQKRDLAPLYFHDVELLEERQVYWATPTKFPPLPIPPLEYAGTARDVVTEGEAFWWLVGRYLADGFLSMDRSNDKGRRVHWVVHPDQEQAIWDRTERVGLKPRSNVRSHSSANDLQVCSAPLYRWLLEHFGQHADGKKIPMWALGMDKSDRSALLDGYLVGDGHVSESKNRIELGTASRMLALGLQFLAQSVGYSVNCSVVQPKVAAIMAVTLKKQPLLSYRLQLSTSGHAVQIGDHHVAKVKTVVPVGKKKVFNPIIEEDHSYVSGSIVSHNIHPIWLELDEGQDYPDPGWIELVETLKRGHEGAVWRVHGVTRGIRDYFYKFTQPDSGWKVHRMVAMHRPNWTDQERQEKIDMYGSKDAPDYRRNVLGLHGDSTNPLFVLHRLMKCVDIDETSDFNTAYQYIRINAEYLVDVGGDIRMVLDLPPPENKTKYWIGMDVGYCLTPDTEMLTRSGWKKWDEVRPGVDETLSINPVTQQSEWQVVDEVHVFDRRPRDMIEMKGQSFSAMTTPNHRWFVQTDSGKWRWKTTETLNTKDYVPLAVDRGDAPIAPVVKDEFVELVGWFWTEGCFGRNGGNIGQSWKINPLYVEQIDRSLRAQFGEPGRMTGPYAGRPLWSRTDRTNGMTYFHLSPTIVKQLRVVLSDEKVPSPAFLCDLTHEQLLLFINTSCAADGWTQNGQRKFGQGNEQRIRAFEMACALAGLATSTSYQRRDEQRDWWHCAILNSRRTTPVKAAKFPRKSTQAMTVERKSYDGVIWCPTLKNHNWLARRNGSVYFTGNTNHPSEILVFAERNPKNKESFLELVCRVHLERISHGEQVSTILTMIRHFMPGSFALDKTGLGLPLFQDIQERATDLAPRIKGYNFSSKILVDFDETVVVDPYMGDRVKDAGIERNVLEYASDVLRDLVDHERLHLPYDKELIREFQGQTWTADKSGMDMYGRRRIYSAGSFHALDAARMAVLGWKQFGIEELMATHANEPVLDQFIY